MEWKEVRLGDVCEIYGRIGFRGYTTNDLVDTPKEGAISLSPKNIINGELNLDKCTYIKWDKYYESPEIMINPNEIIITKTGSSVGRTTFVRRVVHPMTLNPQLVVLKNISENAEFLSYYIKSALFQSVLKSIVVGSAIPTLSQKNLANLIINVPKEVAYQHRIASILSSLDRKIELNNKINADLEEMAQAIFKNWFVDFEPFKNGKFVDSELGMIPEGWKVGCLGDLITIKYGKDHKKLEDGTFPVYGSGGFMRFVNSWLYDGESVLIPRKGTLDNIMYVCEKFWTVDTMFFSVPKMDYVMKYVYNYIKRFDFSKMNEGTSVPSNTAARLNKMPILIPTHEILEMYDETLCPIYNKRKMKDKESRILSTLRDTLLPRLMSGELEVPE